MEGKMRPPNHLLAVCLAGLMLLGCGETEEPVDAPPIQAPSKPDLVWNDPESGGGGGSAPSGPATVSEPVSEAPDLEFRLELDRIEFELGRSIPARLVLKNVSDHPIRIYDPGRCLPADLTFRVDTPDRRSLKIKEHKDIREQSVTEDDLVTIPPGGIQVATIDLEATLRSAGRGLLTGGYRIRTTFTGGHQGSHLTMDVWNRGGGKSLEAPLVLLSLAWPARLTALGVTPEVDAMATDLLSRVGRDGQPTEAARRELRALGDRGYATLVEKLAAAAARTPDEQLIGWNAYNLLREACDPALTALTTSPEAAKTPIGRMLAHYIDSDRRRSASHEPTPTDQEYMSLFRDPRRRPGAVFRVSRAGNEKSPGDAFTIEGSGALHYERSDQPEKTVLTGTLSEKARDRLFRVLADERVWLSQAVREGGTTGETRLVFEILEKQAGAEGPESPRWRLEVWETEAARFSPSLVKVIAALGEAKLALKR